MVYLVIMIAVAVAGLTRLWLAQRREHKKHVLEDYRGSLERLSMVPLAQQVAPPPPKDGFGARLKERVEQRREERRAEREAMNEGFDWEIDLTGPEPTGHLVERPAAPARAEREPLRPARRARTRRSAERDPDFVTLFGRPLWRRPKEPWLWTYEGSGANGTRRARPSPRVEAIPQNGSIAAVEGNLARSDRIPGQHSTHMPVFAPPRTRQRESLDPARREAARLRLESRRRTGSRLS